MSKELRELCTPLLYRSISLHVGGRQDLRLSAMLAGDNPGIKHIKEIFLRLEKPNALERDKYDTSDFSSDDEDPPSDVKIPARQSHFTVRLLLDFLPANQLEIFRWQSWEPLSVDNFLLLCKKQKKLKVLQIDPTDRPLTPALEKEPGIFEGMTELNCVDIYPDSFDRLQAAQKLLEAKPNIKQFSISTGYELTHDGPEDLKDSSTRPGSLTRTLFSHMMPFETCQPLNLTCLELCDIEVRVSVT